MQTEEREGTAVDMTLLTSLGSGAILEFKERLPGQVNMRMVDRTCDSRSCHNTYVHNLLTWGSLSLAPIMDLAWLLYKQKYAVSVRVKSVS